jgi:cytidylate kinase
MGCITISRELGSLGTLIAREVADNLGYKMVWREVINEAAARTGAPDVALAMIDDLGLLGLRPSAKMRRAYRDAVHRVIEELAEAGDVVIVGRAGQVILAGKPCVLHVRIIAPLDLRVQRLVERERIAAEAIHARIKESDRTRRTYLRQYYHVDWNDPELYDLVINTARCLAPVAAELICHAVEQLPLPHTQEENRP